MTADEAHDIGYADGYTGSNNKPTIPDDVIAAYAEGVRAGIDQLDTDRDKAAMYNGM